MSAQTASMKRLDALAAIYPRLDHVIVVTIMGAVAAELQSLGHRPNFFYLQHAMGLASSMGLGIALSKPGRKVVVFDGDGSLLMNLGALTTLARYRPGNLLHVVFDNESLLFGKHPRNTDYRDRQRAVRRLQHLRNRPEHRPIERTREGHDLSDGDAGELGVPAVEGSTHAAHATTVPVASIPSTRGNETPCDKPRRVWSSERFSPNAPREQARTPYPRRFCDDSSWSLLLCDVSAARVQARSWLVNRYQSDRSLCRHGSRPLD